MFGTDYPIFTSNVSAEAMATARLTEAEHALVSLGTANAILARNAARRAAA
jgi:predicted TIM-barrel fold metal-dependent hydrolase